jgi:hypothetical protein
MLFKFWTWWLEIGMSNFAMGTILRKGFPQAQVHTVHSTIQNAAALCSIRMQGQLFLFFSSSYISVHMRRHRHHAQERHF